MDSIGALWKTLPYEFLRVIRFSNYYARCPNHFVQADLKLTWRKNVVGVCGETKGDWKKLGDRESRARCHAREVRMNMTDPRLLQAQPDMNSLRKAQKIGAAATLMETSDNRW